jgi:hypothetical protein
MLSNPRIHLELPRNEAGVCQILVGIYGGAGTGKTTLLAALAPLFAPPEKTQIVSPIPVLKEKLPYLEWVRLTASDPEQVERYFRPLVPAPGAGLPAPRFILADEFDELTTERGYVGSSGDGTGALYDFVNYGRNYGHGAAICARGTRDVAKNYLQSIRLLFIAQTTEPGSTRYLAEWMYDPAQPEVDYKRIVRVLPSNPEDGFVFLVWAPRASRKFQGYIEVRDGRIVPWSPDRLKRQAGPAPEATDEIAGTDEAAGTGGKSVSGAGPLSPTAPGPNSAPTVSSASVSRTLDRRRPGTPPA